MNVEKKAILLKFDLIMPPLIIIPYTEIDQN